MRKMPGQRCTVCGTSRTTNPEDTFHRIPRQKDRRALWLKEFSLQEDDVKASTRVCSRHFPDGDATKPPSVLLGKRFASPVKRGPRALRARTREEEKMLRESRNPTPVSITSLTPLPAASSTTSHTAEIGEQLVSESDYSIHELPDTLPSESSSSENVLVNCTLLARIEMLESENNRLKEVKVKKRSLSSGRYTA